MMINENVDNTLKKMIDISPCKYAFERRYGKYTEEKKWRFFVFRCGWIDAINVVDINTNIASVKNAPKETEIILDRWRLK